MTSDADRLRHLLAAGIAGGSTASLPGEGWQPPAPETLAGVFPRLEVLELLGRGGMGAVYKARQTPIGRIVALKLLDPRLGRDPAFAERFRREALALARLAHPNIVAFHDAGEAGGWHWLLMEHVDGATLRDALRTGRFSPAETLRLVPQLCEALAYAHAQGVVHRDLKPENILIDAAGRPRIADFGLAKLSGHDAGDGITRTGEMLGTAAYMAPEQVAGGVDVDHRADLYALGVVIYEMLTGQLPLGRFEPPSQRAAVDRRVDEVVLRALARAPEQRWQSAAEVGRAVGALAAPPAAGAARRAWDLALVAVAGLAAVVVIALFVPRPPESGGAAAPPAVSPPIASVPPSVPADLPPEPRPLPPPAAEVTGPVAEVAAPVPAMPVAPQPTTAQAVAAQPIEPSAAMPAVPVAAAVAARVAEPVVAAEPPVAVPAAPASTASTAPVGAEPPPTVPASQPAPTEPSLALTEIAGDGELVVDLRADATMPTRAALAAVTGLIFGATGDGGARLQVAASAGPVRLALPLGAFRCLRHVGTGAVTVRGATQDALAVEHAGSGGLAIEGLVVDRLTIVHAGDGPLRVAGHARAASLQSGGRAAPATVQVGPGSSVLVVPRTRPFLLDASALQAEELTVGIAGIADIHLAGRARTLRFVGSGTGDLLADALQVEAADLELHGTGDVHLGGRTRSLRLVSRGAGDLVAGSLDVDAADVVMTGSGDAQLGRIGVLDVTCTGTGLLRYAGRPRLGRVVTDR